MYSRKVQQSIIHSSPNLKNIISDNNVGAAKLYFSRYCRMFRTTTLSEACENLCNVKDKMRTLVKDAMVLRTIRNRLSSIPGNLKDQSSNLLRIWAHQCECVFAQRLRRGQQMFCLYSKMWEEHVLRDLIRRMRQHVSRHGKEFMLSAVGLTGYNWNKNRISDEEILQHLNDVEYTYALRDATCTSVFHGCKRNKDGNVGTRSLDDWVPFIEQKDLIVWRRQHSSGHYEYKVYGSYNDVTAEDFLNVQVDIEYRRVWDNTAVSLEVIEEDPDPMYDSDLVYWEMLWPRLFANRDYVFNRRFVVDKRNKKIIIVSQSTEHPSYPVKPDNFRVKDYRSCMVIKPYKELDKNGIEFVLTYYDNPGVNIPASVTSWVAYRAMPDFLSRLREASKQYRLYCTSLDKSNYRVKRIFEDSPREKEERNVKKRNDFGDLSMDGIATEPEKRERIADNSHDLIVDSTAKEPERTKQKSSPEKKEPQRTEMQSLFPNRDQRTDLADNVDIMISPSLTTQADAEVCNSYWKYLHPTYYFS